MRVRRTSMEFHCFRILLIPDQLGIQAIVYHALSNNSEPIEEWFAVPREKLLIHVRLLKLAVKR